MQYLIRTLLIVLATGPMAIAQSPDSRKEEDAILTVIAGLTDAFNQHNAKAWTHLAMSDADLVTVRGESMKGVKEIENGLTLLCQGRNRNASVKVLDVKVRLLSANVALAHVTTELSGVVNSEGQSQPGQRELSLQHSHRRPLHVPLHNPRLAVAGFGCGVGGGMVCIGSRMESALRR